MGNQASQLDNNASNFEETSKSNPFIDALNNRISKFDIDGNTLGIAQEILRAITGINSHHIGELGDEHIDQLSQVLKSENATARKTALEALKAMLTSPESKSRVLKKGLIYTIAKMKADPEPTVRDEVTVIIQQFTVSRATLSTRLSTQHLSEHGKADPFLQVQLFMMLDDAETNEKQVIWALNQLTASNNVKQQNTLPEHELTLLLQLTQHQNLTIANKAIETLSSFCKNNTQNRNQITSGNAVTTTLSLLKRKDNSSLKAVIDAILMLSKENPNYQRSCISEGIITALVEHIQNTNSKKKLSYGAKALSFYAEAGFEEEVCSMAKDHLISLLSAEDAPIMARRYASKTIASLCKKSSCRKALSDPKVIQTLLQLSNHTDKKIATPTTEAIKDLAGPAQEDSNSSKELEERREQIANGIDSLLELCESPDCIQQQFSIQALETLSKNPTKHSHFFAEGQLARLAHLLGVSELQASILGVFSNLAKHNASINLLILKNISRYLVCLLDSQVKGVASAAMNLIFHLAQSKDTHDKLLSSNIQEYLLEHAKDSKSADLAISCITLLCTDEESTASFLEWDAIATLVETLCTLRSNKISAIVCLHHLIKNRPDEEARFTVAVNEQNAIPELMLAVINADTTERKSIISLLLVIARTDETNKELIAESDQASMLFSPELVASNDEELIHLTNNLSILVGYTETAEPNSRAESLRLSFFNGYSRPGSTTLNTILEEGDPTANLLNQKTSESESSNNIGSGTPPVGLQ